MRKALLTIFLIVPLLMACSPKSSDTKMQSMFKTKEEAEQAAKNFNCAGAHKMGDKWMPCKSHKSHEKDKTKSSHGHGHHKH
tara:strand:+ start:90 stop:335 length:246 start_codon:yes stop_codon:yes gene_type:complete